MKMVCYMSVAEYLGQSNAVRICDDVAAGEFAYGHMVH
jgi:hypothetical protein